MKDTLLNIVNLSLAYEDELVVDQINLKLHSDEILCIVGESGSGKTTLLRGICRDKNVLVLSGDVQTDLNRMGVISQNPNGAFNPLRRFDKQLRETLVSNGLEYREQEILDLFERIGLQDGASILRSRPFEMSGGMNQRIAIAATMLLEPKMLLCDEPTSALDEEATKAVLSELKRMSVENGTSIIMVTHDMQAVREICDHVLVLKNGNVVEQGSVSQVLNNPESDYTKALLDAVPVSRSDEWKISLA